MSNWISDCTKPGAVAYRCQKQIGNVKVIASVRETVVRRGAYEMNTSAYNATLKALGSKQQQIAADLLLEAKGELARALYAAGWSSEQITWGGSQVVLWWPKR